MMNYRVQSISRIGNTVNNEEIYHVVLSNNGKYSNIGLKSYYMIYIPRANNESILRDYISLPLYEPLYDDSYIDELLEDSNSWIESFILKVDDYTAIRPSYGYTEWPYKLYIAIDSNKIDHTKDKSIFNKKFYEYPENDYLENRLEYDKILERCIVEIQLGDDNYWSFEV